MRACCKSPLVLLVLGWGVAFVPAPARARDLVITGRIDAGELGRRFESHRRAIGICARERPAFVGGVELRVDLRPSGKIIGISAIKPVSPRTARLTRCLVSRSKGWMLGRWGRGGGTMGFSVTLDLPLKAASAQRRGERVGPKTALRIMQARITSANPRATRALRLQISRLRPCLLGQLITDVRRVTGKLVLAPEGHPRRVSANGGDARVRRCLHKKLKQWRFPPAGNVGVAYFSLYVLSTERAEARARLEDAARAAVERARELRQRQLDVQQHRRHSTPAPHR